MFRSRIANGRTILGCVSAGAAIVYVSYGSAD